MLNTASRLSTQYFAAQLAHRITYEMERLIKVQYLTYIRACQKNFYSLFDIYCND